MQLKSNHVIKKTLKFAEIALKQKVYVKYITLTVQELQNKVITYLQKMGMVWN